MKCLTSATAIDHIPLIAYHFNGVVVNEFVSSCYDNLWGEGILHCDPKSLLNVFTDRHTSMVPFIHLLQH